MRYSLANATSSNGMTHNLLITEPLRCRLLERGPSAVARENQATFFCWIVTAPSNLAISIQLTPRLTDCTYFKFNDLFLSAIKESNLVEQIDCQDLYCLFMIVPDFPRSILTGSRECSSLSQSDASDYCTKKTSTIPIHPLSITHKKKVIITGLFSSSFTRAVSLSVK